MLCPGIAMTVSWGLVAPLGMSLSLMCKSVCPGKAWFIVRSDITILRDTQRNLKVRRELYKSLKAIFAIAIQTRDKSCVNVNVLILEKQYCKCTLHVTPLGHKLPRRQEFTKPRQADGF